MRLAVIICVLVAVQLVYCKKCNKTRPTPSATSTTTIADEIQQDVVENQAPPPGRPQGASRNPPPPPGGRRDPPPPPPGGRRDPPPPPPGGPRKPPPGGPNNNGSRPCRNKTASSTTAATSTDVSSTTATSTDVSSTSTVGTADQQDIVANQRGNRHHSKGSKRDGSRPCANKTATSTTASASPDVPSTTALPEDVEQDAVANQRGNRHHSKGSKRDGSRPCANKTATSTTASASPDVPSTTALPEDVEQDAVANQRGNRHHSKGSKRDGNRPCANKTATSTTASASPDVPSATDTTVDAGV